jgi:hypothetical protein
LLFLPFFLGFGMGRGGNRSDADSIQAYSTEKQVAAMELWFVTGGLRDIIFARGNGLPPPSPPRAHNPPETDSAADCGDRFGQGDTHDGPGSGRNPVG